MTVTRVFFSTLAGMLLCLGLGNVTNLLAEDPKTKPETAPASVPEGGKLFGIVTNFGYNWTKIHGPKLDTRLSLKAEGETDPVDYLLALPNEAVDPKLETALKKVFPSNTVSMQWEMRDGKRLVTNISVLSPTKGQGTMVGIVMERSSGGLDLKGSDRRAVTTRYAAAWDPVAKGPSPALAAALQGVSVGDKVKIVWSANFERVFVNEVKLVARAADVKPAGGSKTAPSSPAKPKP